MFSSLQNWLGISDEGAKKKPLSQRQLCLRKTRRDRRIRKKQSEPVVPSASTSDTPLTTSLLNDPDTALTLNTSPVEEENVLVNVEEKEKEKEKEKEQDKEKTYEQAISSEPEQEQEKEKEKAVPVKSSARKTRSRRRS
jgi:hypothetical protein